MILGSLIVALLAANGCFHGINYGLPNYIVEQNFGLVELFYRLLRIVAPLCFMYPIVTLTWHWPTILLGSILYLLAFGIKKLARHLSYKEYL